MKKTYLFLCLAFVFGISVVASGQTAPDLTTLKHQWTFDDGTANDGVGGLNGTLMEGATISSNALNTTKGGYCDFDGPTLAINQYTSITTEVWFTAATGNGDYTMLTVYGNTGTGGGGENYLCTNPTHGGEGSRTSITTNNPDSWSGRESGANGPKCDDGKLHQLVSVVDGVNGTISLYIDGEYKGQSPLSFLNNDTPPVQIDNLISALGTDHFYLAKSNWAPDKSWKGLMEKVSIYEAALSPDEILYLFNKGAESKQVITPGVPSMVFDTNDDAVTNTITGLNLTSPITITCPAGLTAQISGSVVTSIPANSVNTEVTFAYDGNAPIDGSIVLTSGLITSSIPVKAVSATNCFVPLYEGSLTNIVPGNGVMNSLAGFAGWGSRTVETIISNPADVYCGAASMKIGDPSLGSLDFHPGIVSKGGLLLPSTTYRVKLMAKTTGVFNVGIERTDSTNTINSNNKILYNFDTNGQWKVVDFYFTTGDQPNADPVIYINAFNLSGTIAIVDNWEIYPTTDPLIFPTVTSLAYDLDYRSSLLNVTSMNLLNDITVTVPAGISVDQTLMTANYQSDPLTVSWDGKTPVTGNVTLTSGSTTVLIPVKTTTTTNSSCFTPLYTDGRSNFIPDPFLNDKSLFNGWVHDAIGSWGMIDIATNPDSVYCGSHSVKLYSNADIEVPLTGLLQANSGYVARAMVRTIGGFFHMGINHIDTSIPEDLVDSIDTEGAWKEMTFRFNTGTEMGDPVIFFNNFKNNGRVAYLDNWELYKMDELNAVVPVKDLFEKLYVQNGKIVADFELEQSTNVQLTVYTVTGSIVSNEIIAGTSGLNHQVIETILPSGVYMVKIMKNGISSFRKLIK